ncbi:hypothetical protein [Undibacterium aquatile]|uniref:Uncharacterized protein n=1 Tax=Undibacterium aquatile TaxID=1537398 RepID=A0ABR6XI71_9BURK|nr:hypothetical protein [Undibacterium aquatile]MBC3812571.1 hypothetical protein [Undibacterium aquatile]
MDAMCYEPSHASPTVVIVDKVSKERKTERFESLPDDVRYKPQLRTCKDVERTIMVPVAEIRVSQVDNAGKLVQKELATSLLIEYFDKDGKVLEVVRMAK